MTESELSASALLSEHEMPGSLACPLWSTGRKDESSIFDVTLCIESIDGRKEREASPSHALRHRGMYPAELKARRIYGKFPLPWNGQEVSPSGGSLALQSPVEDSEYMLPKVLLNGTIDYPKFEPK